MRIVVVALAAMLASTGVSLAQYSRAPSTVAPSTTAPSNRPMNADQFSSEADAKAHCGTTPVVWMNLKSHVYHFSGYRDYGHTKQGAFMCQTDADRAGRAAKNEHAR